MVEIAYTISVHAMTLVESPAEVVATTPLVRSWTNPPRGKLSTVPLQVNSRTFFTFFHYIIHPTTTLSVGMARAMIPLVFRSTKCPKSYTPHI